ncbi:MAG: hypothetical protein ACLS37_12625 [Alistipes sp.]
MQQSEDKCAATAARPDPASGFAVRFRGREAELFLHQQAWSITAEPRRTAGTIQRRGLPGMDAPGDRADPTRRPGGRNCRRRWFRSPRRRGRRRKHCGDGERAARKPTPTVRRRYRLLRRSSGSALPGSEKRRLLGGNHEIDGAEQTLAVEGTSTRLRGQIREGGSGSTSSHPQEVKEQTARSYCGSRRKPPGIIVFRAPFRS